MTASAPASVQASTPTGGAVPTDGPRTELDPDELGPRAFYKLLTATVVPRPIAWVSTRSAAGVVNLAPHSFFTVACVDPPMVQFTSVRRKDSLNNVEETDEFVVCLAGEPLYEQINATGTNFPPDVDEFAAVGLTPAASLRVTSPRVAESPVALECVRHALVNLGDCTLVIGRVVHASITTAAFDGDPHDGGVPAIDALRPLARLGRNEWSTIGEVREITRIPHREWPGHYTPRQ